MHLSISQEIPSRCPQAALGVLQYDAQVEPSSAALLEVFDRAIDELSARYTLGDIAQIPHIAATRQAYKALGMSPHEYRNAAEAMLRRVVKVLIAAFAALAMLEILGFPVGSLIAGLGLGGLTVSLAAKDTASNLFAGLVLLVEKPFAIGDWVTCAGVEGAVEDITFRSTKIRTLANTLTVCRTRWSAPG